MRYTICGFNQEEVLKCNKAVPGEKAIKLDYADLLILRWFANFYPDMTKTEVDGKEYAWVSYDAILDDLPILYLKKLALYNRLKKMCELGVLEHYTIKKCGTYSYYRFGERYNNLIKPLSEGMQTTADSVYQNIEGVYQNIEGIHQNIEGVYSEVQNGSIPNYRGGLYQTIEQNNQYTKYNPSTKNNQSTKNNTYIAKHKYGEYKNVLLSDEDMEKLKTEFPYDYQERIENLSGYIASTGKTYKNHLATIRNWARKDSKAKPKHTGSEGTEDIFMQVGKMLMEKQEKGDDIIDV